MENKIVTSISRLEANRANAKKSTGPRTEEGKQKSSLNALKHGLTAHTLVLPTEDIETYQTFLARFHKMHLPETDQERELVDSLANTKWRLNRCGALEANLFALGLEEQSPENDVDSGLAIAQTFRTNADLLLKLSTYEQRLMRIYQTTKKELEQVQTARRATVRAEHFEAVKIRNVHEQNDLPCVLANFGFVSPEHVMDQYIRRREAGLGNLEDQISPPSV